MSVMNWEHFVTKQLFPYFVISICLYPQQPTLSDMTMYELNFSLLVEQMLSKIVEPAYRQIMVEVRAPPPPPDQGLTLLDSPHTGRSWWRFVHPPSPTTPGLDPAGFPTYRQIMVEVCAPPPPPDQGLTLLDSPHTGRSWWRLVHPPPLQTRAWPCWIPHIQADHGGGSCTPSPTRPGLDPAGFPTYRHISGITGTHLA